MGHFQKHTPGALEKIVRANRINAKKVPKEKWREWQKLAINAGKERGSYKGTLGRRGKLSANWKGESASYSSKHKWILRYWAKTGKCQICGAIPKPKPNGRLKNAIQWHNLDGKYSREKRETWIEVCIKCHYGYNAQTRY